MTTERVGNQNCHGPSDLGAMRGELLATMEKAIRANLLSQVLAAHRWESPDQQSSSLVITVKGGTTDAR